jgi:TonB family protein
LTAIRRAAADHRRERLWQDAPMTCVLLLALLAGIGSAGAAQPPAQPVRIGQGIPPPQKTKDVRPVYPRDAQAARVSGVVVIEATIGEDGKVRDAVVLRSIPLLDQASIDAVRQWEFTPTVVDGRPVPVIMTVTVNFALQGVAPVDSVPIAKGGPSPPVRLAAMGTSIWEIPLERAAALPHWNLDAGDPPMSVADARQIARTWLAARNPQPATAPLAMQSAMLLHVRRGPDVDFWYYQITFSGPPPQGQPPRVFVLPDRSVVEPKQQ